MDPLAPIRAFDRLQRRHGGLGFPVAVLRKCSDDHASHLAALIAYYGFFSLFPLLLVFVTVLGFVLQGDPALHDRILDSALGQFPVIGKDLKVNGLHGSAVALVLGLAGALWAGLGVTLAGQRAMDEVWDVPQRLRRDFFMSRLRGLLILAVLGALNVAVTTGVGLIVGGLGSAGLQVFGIAVSALLDVVLFYAVFRLLTQDCVPTRDLWLGIVLAAVGWAVLQTLGGWYVKHVVGRANATYSVFALVIGLLSWLYLGAQLLLYAAEANVVRVRRLWPRGLYEPATRADDAALAAAVREQQRRADERVEVSFGERTER